MQKKLTIENIITTAILITSVLLMIAFYSFYQNHKKLRKLQKQLHDTELKLNLEQFNMDFDKVLLPDAREIFRPDILGSHPINGLQLSVMEYLFSTYSYNAFSDNQNTLKSSLKDILHIKRKHEIYYARHNLGFVFLLLLSALTLSIFLLFCLLKYKKAKLENIKTEIPLGPAGFFQPIPKESATSYFKEKKPYKIPKRHYTDLLLDIKEIGISKKTHIKSCYKPLKRL
jgi:hypothetical protein